MQYVEEIRDDEKVVIARFVGVLTSAKLVPKATEARIAAKVLGYGIVFDYRNAKCNISIVEAYNWLSNHYDKIAPGLRFLPVAHLYSHEDRALFEFIETSWTNKGVFVRRFKEEGDAIAWLKTISRLNVVKRNGRYVDI